MIDDPKVRREALNEIAQEVAYYTERLRVAGMSADDAKSLAWGYSNELCRARDLLPNLNEPRPW